jgi:hypothetical protein
MEHRYTTGETIRVGDKVRIGPTASGVVVGILDSGTYANGFVKEHWDGYRTGVLVDSADFGLTLYQHEDTLEDLTKIG